MADEVERIIDGFVNLVDQFKELEKSRYCVEIQKLIDKWEKKDFWLLDDIICEFIKDLKGLQEFIKDEGV